MFPSAFTEQITETVQEEKTDTGVDFLFDYELGQHVMRGSVLSECDSSRKVWQYIKNVLMTPANEYKDYIKGEKEVFGLSVYNYIGQKNLPVEYISSELKREVMEQLLRHPLIKEVREWKTERERRGLAVSFTAVLTDDNLIKMSEIVGGVI